MATIDPGQPELSPWPAHTVLGTLTPPERTALINAGRPQRYRASETMIMEGLPDRHVIVLLNGYAKVLSVSADGTTILLSIRGGGDIVGELSALDGRPRSASVLAVTPVEAAVIDHDTFRRFLAGHPGVSHAINTAMAAKLRMATERRVQIGGVQVITKLARVLDFLATHHGTHGKDGIHIDVPLSQVDIASLIGAAEPSLQRALARLRRHGAVHTGRKQLVVLNRSRLLDFATEPPPDDLALP